MKEGFDNLHRLIVHVVIALVSVMAAGFGGIAVLIAA
jgi:hypothetical protein